MTAAGGVGAASSSADGAVAAADAAEFDSSSARFFIGDAFAAAGLETPNPVGKILLIDQILMLAQQALHVLFELELRMIRAE